MYELFYVNSSYTSKTITSVATSSYDLKAMSDGKDANVNNAVEQR